jgi:uncharacterized OB-fold protein
MSPEGGTKPEPVPTPETQPFWDGCAESQLTAQRCAQCEEFTFPPRASCPRCGTQTLKWLPLSGEGEIYSYVISHLAAPGFENDVPYAIAVIELVEGIRMLGNLGITHPTPEDIQIGGRVRVAFRAQGAVSVPYFDLIESQE